DVLVNLAVGGQRSVAVDYALSLASAYEAHVSAVAFAYEPVIAGSLMGGMPAGAIEMGRAEGRKAADDAIARFTKPAELAGGSFETRKLEASLVGCADLFGQIARRYDLSVVAQPEPGKMSGDGMIVEAALFQSGRPLIVVPYIQRGGHTAERVLVGWDGSST